MKPYGMGPPKLADTLQISLEEAEELFVLYAKAFPKLNKWLKDEAAKAKKNMYSTTLAPCYRRRWYPNMKLAKKLRAEGSTDWKTIFKIEGETERNGPNHIIQGSGADICKEALVEIRKLVKEYNTIYQREVAQLVCTVHDAIDSITIDEIAEEFARRKEQIMKEVGNKYVSQVSMEVDTTITQFWTK